MSLSRCLTGAEIAVLESALPDGLRPDMRDVALCLFEAMALMDSRAGQTQPDAAWLAVLRAMTRVACAQLQRLMDEMGGDSLYLAKGVAVYLSARDREICAEFRGNYDALARKHLGAGK